MEEKPLPAGCSNHRIHWRLFQSCPMDRRNAFFYLFSPTLNSSLVLWLVCLFFNLVIRLNPGGEGSILRMMMVRKKWPERAFDLSP
jgi:hypothetical protein